MNKIPKIFDNRIADLNRLEEVSAIPAPRSRYIIAMTPRSGSSYLCDVMKKIKRFGTPDEVINQEFIPGIMKKIPGRTPDEYIRNVIRVRKTGNGISGFKASWFQFRNFMQAMTDHDYLSGFKYIYLTRRDLAAQAVSLCKATASSVFHTNVQHDDEAIRKLELLEYNFDRINEWYEHIAKQEKGWQSYFFENRIFPLCITYEDVEEDILMVLKRIATFVGVKPEKFSMPEEPSVFKKVRDKRNGEWAHRFALERSLQEDNLSPNGLVSENVKAVKRG